MKQTQGIRLRAAPARNTRAGGATLPEAAAFACGILLPPSLAYCKADVWLLLGAAVGLCVVLCVLRSRLKGALAPLLPAALLAAICFFARDALISGLCACGNAVLARLTVLRARIYLPLTRGDAGNPFWFLLAAAALICGISVYAGRKTRAVLAGLWMPLSVLAAMLGFVPTAAALLCVLLLALHALLPSLQVARFTPRRALSLMLLPALCAALCVPVARLRPQQDSQLLSALRRTLHELRYDSDTGSMPEGQLANLSPWKKSGETALLVTMQEPQKLYLRGFTGETYTGTAWEPLSGETLAGYADVFYSLHEQHYFSQSAIGTALSLTQHDTPQAVTVENRAACRAQNYLPYALAGQALLDAAVIGDNRTAEAEASAEFLCYSGSVPEWYALQQALAARQTEAEISQYLALESAYRDFAQTQYLSLTEQSVAAVEALFGQDMQGKTLQEIRLAIRQCLLEKLTYDESCYTLSGTQDFLQYVQAVNPRGYSVHYATAATLMLRYCGVPARYVEGYYLSADEAAQYAAGDEIVLCETHAHAWAEYYLDGVGWIPFEVTPNYIDAEENALGAFSSEKRYENTERPQPSVSQPQEERSSTSPHGGFYWARRLLPWFGLLALLVLLALPLVRRIRLRRRLRAMHAAAPRVAIPLLYGYACWLRRRAKLTLPQQAAEAERLNCEAMFSNHEMTTAQQAQMCCYVETLLAQCRARRLYRRLYNRVVLCLY